MATTTIKKAHNKGLLAIKLLNDNINVKKALKD